MKYNLLQARIRRATTRRSRLLSVVKGRRSELRLRRSKVESYRECNDEEQKREHLPPIVDGSVNPPSDVWRQDEAGAVDIGGQHYTRWEFGDSALFIDADSALNNVVDNGEHGVFT